jgi:hypothetical protein
MALDVDRPGQDDEPTVVWNRPLVTGTLRPGPRRRRPRRPRYFHGGAFSMLIIATMLAVFTAFAATVIYATVDAGRPLPTAPTTAPTPNTPHTTLAAPPGPTTTRAPQDLSQEDLAKKVAGSVRVLNTLNEAGQPVTGTAFVVGTFNGQTFLVTSFSLVRAATRSPGPPITLGGREVTLWTWEESRDLALLVTGTQIESLPWAPEPPKPGEKVYVGGAEQRLSVGIVTGVTGEGVDHNVFIDDVRQGAPVVNQKGEVLAMASKAYNPGGRGTDTVFIAVPIKLTCERVLRCGTGNTSPTETTPTSTPNPSTTTRG